LLSCNIYPGEIILSKMGDPVARACLIPNSHERYVMCSDGIRLVVDESKHSKFFIYSFINSAQFRELADKTATDFTRKRIGLDELKNLTMLVPELGEQQKIAACISSLDELITAESQKLEHLQSHKKGLMQQLFPAGDETVPKLRFPEFRDGLEWDIDFFDDLVEIIDSDRGDNYPKSDEFSSSGYCVFLNAKNVTKKVSRDNFGTNER
jgi:type I restriction enzyme, S subunit